MKSNIQLIHKYPEAYNQGKEACIACDCQPDLGVNPHEEGSDPWKAWNIGWNRAGIA